MSKKSKKKQLEEKEIEKAAKAAMKEKKEKKQKKEKKEKKEKSAKKQKTALSASVTPEQRLEMIATAAYYIAERHGFTPGESEADWRAAEKEIDELLKQKRKKKTKG